MTAGMFSDFLDLRRFRKQIAFAAIVVLHLMIWVLASRSRLPVKRDHAPSSSYVQIVLLPERKPAPEQKPEPIRPVQQIQPQNTRQRRRQESEITVVRAPEVVSAPAEVSPDTSSDAQPKAETAGAFDIGKARALVRREVREHASEQKAGELLGPDTSASRAIEKARRSDCRTRYASAGLLAVVPLMIDAVRDSGCKW